jgi:phthalate 4,5-dioxygenase oxygenase subunit
VLSHEDNNLLTRVEGDAPIGRMMRENYWVPALLSSQISSDEAPIPVRLLGHDYVAFRASDGRVGLFDEGCPHRGTSLALARNEGCGLRCIFHGWKIDVSGKVVDVPTHTPNAEAFAAKVPVGHYPTHEGGGIVWAWLGMGDAPPFPELPFTVLPQNQVWMTVTKCYCNWLQGIDAAIDSAHVGTLHQAYMARTGDDTANSHSINVLAPKYEVDHKHYGIEAAARRAIGDGSVYLRTTQYVMPFIAMTPGSAVIPAVIFIVSPIDDTHHNLFYGVWANNTEIDDGESVPEILSSAVGTRPYDPHNFGGFDGDKESAYGQDREAMKNGHFSGFVGNLIQEDTVTQASMGPIVDRTREHLSSSDVAIIHARRILLDAVAMAEAGKPPPGSEHGVDLRGVIPANKLLAADGTVTDYYAGCI